MKTIVKTIKLYRYAELSDDARERVKQWYLDGQDADIFSDECKDWLRYKYGLLDMDVQFSLAFCQGDGLNVYGDVAFWELEKILATSGFTQKELKRLELYYEQVYDSIHIPENPHYCYDYSSRIDFSNNWIAELENDGIRDIDEQLIYRFESYLKQVFHEINSELEQRGYEFFYEISEPDLSDVCDANEWHFTADGTYYFD